MARTTKTTLGLTALEARDCPAVWAADAWTAQPAADLARSGVAIRAGDVIVAGERYARVEGVAGGLKVTTETGSVTLPSHRNGVPVRVHMSGTDGADYLDNFTWHESVIFGRGGDDGIHGGWANDVIFGDGGYDDIRGNPGNDKLSADAGGARLDGGDGNDTLYGSDSGDVLYGRAGDDFLYGYGGNDRLEGHDGNDLLDGGAGLDQFSGGRGRDAMYGTNDEVVWRYFGIPYHWSYDTITDFNATEGDFAD